MLLQFVLSSVVRVKLNGRLVANSVSKIGKVDNQKFTSLAL